ncbi:MAG: Sec-independent protein translocase subunit TatA [Actinomycetota bacterium]|nr:Sec-independent protein translocase subunit TatA [Actinomycetota bacterium]
MGILSGWHLLILLVLVILLFGAAKLPTAARAVGQSIRILKAETKGSRSEREADAPAPEHQSLPPSGPAAPGVGEAGVNEHRRDNDTVR